MSRFIADAGPLVYPILVFALLAILYAGLYLISGHRRDSRAASGSAACMGIIAILSVTTGFQLSAMGVLDRPDLDRSLVLAGMSESLNGLTLALVAGFVVTVLLTLGSYRRGRGAESAPLQRTEQGRATAG